MKIFTRVAAGLALGAAMLVVGATDQVRAQNFDGNHQVRAGFFLHGGRTGFDVTGGVQDQSISASAFGIGAVAGLEWIRAGRLSFGAEFDIAANKGSTSLTTPNLGIKAGMDYFASLRGRLGFHVHPDFVIYGTAGFGAAGTELDGLGLTPALNKVSNTNTGGVYGGGFEFHRGGTILFAEYLHGNFGHRSATIGGTVYNYDADINIARVGLKFKLGHDWRDEVRGPHGRDDYKPMK